MKFDDNTKNSKEAPAPQIVIKKKPTKSAAQVQDLSHVFMLRAFTKFFEERAAAMLNLAEKLNDYAAKKEMINNFQNNFSQKQ